MNAVRTGLLLAGMTALFLAIGAVIGGQQGARRVRDRARHERVRLLELRQDGPAHAQCARRGPAKRPGPLRPCRRSRAPCRPARAGDLLHRHRPAQRVRHRAQPAERRDRGHARPDAEPFARRVGWRDRARARPHQEPRHADHDDRGDHRRRDRLPFPIRLVLRRQLGQPFRSARADRRDPDGHPRTDRRNDHSDGHLADPSIPPTGWAPRSRASCSSLRARWDGSSPSRAVGR